MHTCSESLSPFIDSRVNDLLLHTIPDSNEALLQLIDVVHTTFVHTLLHHSPDLVVLSQQMLPAIKHIAGDAFVFQQDSALAHRARDTIQLLQQETPDFIGRDLWPPNSPDLNPLDYKIWGVMRQCL